MPTAASTLASWRMSAATGSACPPAASISAALVSLKRLEAPLRKLGVDPRSIADEGTQRLLKVVDDLTDANQGRKLGVVAGPIVSRSFGAALELTFPRQGRGGLTHRLFDAGRALVYDAA